MTFVFQVVVETIAYKIGYNLKRLPLTWRLIPLVAMNFIYKVVGAINTSLCMKLVLEPFNLRLEEFIVKAI